MEDALDSGGENDGENVLNEPGASKKDKRHIWIESEDLLILRQYLIKDPFLIRMNGRGIVWKDISKDVATAGLQVSPRAVRDRIKKVVDDFKKLNPKDEWKSGCAGKYSEKDKLLVEILQKEEEGARRQAQLDGIKSKDLEKRDRHEKKLMTAAMNLEKKKGKTALCADDDEEDGSAKKKSSRNRWQHSASGFFKTKEEEIKRDGELKEAAMEIERQKIAIQLADQEIQRERLRIDAERFKVEAEERKIMMQLLLKKL